MILDHIGFGGADLERSKRFYVKALAPLGIGIVMEGHGWAGLGREGRPAILVRRRRQGRQADPPRLRRAQPGGGARLPRGGARGRPGTMARRA
jgi:catechol 2,3-dioxygenase-like lactoylglutathione lyase family enzyme